MRSCPEAIDIQTDGEDDRVFDISKVNFEVLRKEFAKSERKASDVQDLRTVIQKRLEKMLLENPSLGGFQDRFDEIVVEYNKEKDRNTIEATFEALMRLTAEMEEEAQSHVALGLTPEQKPIFDLLIQDDLTKEEIKQIKAASVGLLQAVRKRMKRCRTSSASKARGTVCVRKYMTCSTTNRPGYLRPNMMKTHLPSGLLLFSTSLSDVPSMRWRLSLSCQYRCGSTGQRFCR